MAALAAIALGDVEGDGAECSTKLLTQIAIGGTNARHDGPEHLDDLHGDIENLEPGTEGGRRSRLKIGARLEKSLRRLRGFAYLWVGRVERRAAPIRGNTQTVLRRHEKDLRLDEKVLCRSVEDLGRWEKVPGRLVENLVGSAESRDASAP